MSFGEPCGERESSGDNGRVRWDELFADLEAQVAERYRAELDAEVADRVRRERAQVTLRSRLAAAAAPVSLHLAGGLGVEGVVAELGLDWVVVRQGAGRDWLVPLAAVTHVGGLGWSAAAGERDAGRRFKFGFALRALARDRAPVHVYDVSGGCVPGTIDAVGADHLDLSEHPIDVPRRAANVRATRVVPFAAITAVATAGRLPAGEDARAAATW